MTALLELLVLVVGRALAEKGTDAPSEAVAIIREAHEAVEGAIKDPARIADSMERLRGYATGRAAGLAAARDILDERFPDPTE